MGGEEFQEKGVDARRFPIITEISELSPLPPYPHLLRTAKVMQRNYTFLACVYGLFVVTMRCITYVAVYKYLIPIYLRQGQKCPCLFSSLHIGV